MTTWKSFLSLCLKSRDSEELSRLFDCILTSEEKKDISDRFLIKSIISIIFGEGEILNNFP